MKYFVIHSGKDYEAVKPLMEKWSEAYGIQFVVLEGSQQNWEGDATARIRECGKVLYLVGETSADSPYIKIELDIAIKENKEIYVHKLKNENKINDFLLKKAGKELSTDGEFEGEIIIGKSKDKIFILNDTELDENLRSDSAEIEMSLKGLAFEDKDVLLKQYQMFVKTSEDLVSRKQNVNSFYVTLNSLMLSAIVSVAYAAGDGMQIFAANNANKWVWLIAVVLSGIGLIVCYSWITLLKSYSDLNASKMTIIGFIEEKLALKLFDTEWALLTRKLGNKKYKSFTDKEKAIAKIFGAFHIFIGLGCLYLFFCS